MARYWFKERKGGYNLKPICWEGWVATGILVIVVLASGYFTRAFTPHAAADAWFRFILDTVIVIMLFYLFAKDKTERE